MSNTAAWLPSSYSFLTCLCTAERGVNIWCTKAWTCLPHTHRGSVSLYNSHMSRQDRALFPASLCPDYLCCILHFVIFIYLSCSFLILSKNFCTSQNITMRAPSYPLKAQVEAVKRCATSS